METELVISHGGLPPLSARGCEQELTPLSLGQFRRTINGDLIFTGVRGKRYKSIITCRDKTVLATNDLEPGTVVSIQCIQRLWQKVQGSNATLERHPVVESICVIDEQKRSISLRRLDNREVVLDVDHAEKISFISYRPTLEMRVIRYSLLTNEWGGKTGWRLELEEV